MGNGSERQCQGSILGGLCTTAHRVSGSASVRYQEMSMQTSAFGGQRSGPQAWPDWTFHGLQGKT